MFDDFLCDICFVHKFSTRHPYPSLHRDNYSSGTSPIGRYMSYFDALMFILMFVAHIMVLSMWYSS